MPERTQRRAHLPAHTVAHLKGRANAYKRHRRADDPERMAAETALRAAVLEQHVRRAVDEAPPLTETQRARIAALLRTGASG